MLKSYSDEELIILSRKRMESGGYNSSYWVVSKNILDKYTGYKLTEKQRFIFKKFLKII